jgi:predicted acyl esterase
MLRFGFDAAKLDRLSRTGLRTQPLAPGLVYPLTIDLGHIHHTFRSVGPIEIDVSSSNFPRRAPNTNNGNPVMTRDRETNIRVAENKIHHGPATPSFVELPVLGLQRSTTDQSSTHRPKQATLMTR